MRRALFACLAVFVMAMASSSMAQQSAAPQDAVEAVWRPQHFTFQYRSEGRGYACDILEHKVRMILGQLGARDQLIVRRTACRDFTAAAQLEVIMESPVVATPENIREITQHDSEDELIARVRGTALPSAETIERFPAAWQSIALQRAPRLNLDDRDCALVQQLRRQVVPRMSVQIVKDIDRVDCTQASPRLTVVALVATL